MKRLFKESDDRSTPEQKVILEEYRRECHPEWHRLYKVNPKSSVVNVVRNGRTIGCFGGPTSELARRALEAKAMRQAQELEDNLNSVGSYI